MNRLMTIGDIHGEYFKLKNLIKKLKPHKSDTVVFLGDYIDRGLYSKFVGWAFSPTITLSLG